MPTRLGVIPTCACASMSFRYSSLPTHMVNAYGQRPEDLAAEGGFEVCGTMLTKIAFTPNYFLCLCIPQRRRQAS